MTGHEKESDPRYESHLQELFSDLFATYALGPSLALTCVLLRFSPSRAESYTHPSNSQRVWWMLETLSNMDKTEGDHTFSTIADKCRESWTAALQASGEPEALSDGEMRACAGGNSICTIW